MVKSTSKALLIEDSKDSKVDRFLNSVERNSIQTRNTYNTALSHFQTFISNDKRYSKFTVENIPNALLKNQVNVYSLIDDFISFLLQQKLSSNSIILYVAGIRSYFLYWDIDIVPAKFKRRVKLPKNHREDEEPIDTSDIRKILLSCNNLRLKSYLLVLASGAMRANEAAGIRNCDIDFTTNPTKVHIRAEYAKTRTGRDIYISDEATKFVKEWLELKYKQRANGNTLVKSENDLVFGRQNIYLSPRNLYNKLWVQFNNVLHTVKMDDRKDGMLRRKFTFHSFRRNAYTTICDVTDQAYAEWFLGHSKSVYHTKKEAAKREIYATKIMKYLTFLDYEQLERSTTEDKSLKVKLAIALKENSELKRVKIDEIDEIAQLKTDMKELQEANKSMLKYLRAKGELPEKLD